MNRKKKGGFQDLLYKTIMPKIYGIGAAVVIVGALFKINHYPGAGIMLGVGLGVEAIIFFLSAFEPPHQDPDWAKVYPELEDNYSGSSDARSKTSIGKKADGVSQKLDRMFENAKIGPALVESLSKGMNNLAANAKRMASISSAAVATDEYSKHVRVASKNLIDMSSSYAKTAQSMNSMADAAGNAKRYHEEVRGVTKKLGALNSVYELELQSTDSHVKTMTKFYGNMAGVMENMEKAGKGTAKFSQEMQKLTGNLTSLNGIYGSMLTAMKGGS